MDWRTKEEDKDDSEGVARVMFNAIGVAHF
jgi:hypothetical protein